MLPLRMLGPLILIISLCDADSLCPTELNRLTLDPPKVRGRHNETVGINCSSIDDIHNGMYWSFGNKKSTVVVDKGFISGTVLLSDWNVTAECRIELIDGSECSKELEIIVYQNPDVTMFPVKYLKTAVEGTEYELQCDIIEVAPVKNLVVSWYKGNETIMTQNFTNNVSKKPVTESSILKVNLSRGEDGAEFRCEAQLDFGPLGQEAPVISETQHISVHYAPELKNKTNIFSLENEGDNVTLNCEAVGNPPPALDWKCDKVDIMDTDRMIQHITLQTTTICNCTATNNLGTTMKTFTLQVPPRIVASRPAPAAMTTPAAPLPRGCQLLLMPEEMVVRFGDPATANCSTSATDASIIGWEAEDGGRSAAPPVVIWEVKKLDDFIKAPVCWTTLEDGSQCNKTLDITIYKTPDIVSISAVNDSVEEGKDYTLKCRIYNVAPVQKLKVKWYQNNETVKTETFPDTTVTPVDVSSELTVRAERDYNGAVFRCEAELHLGPKGPEYIPTKTSPTLTANVLYKPLTPVCPGSDTGVEHLFFMDMVPCLVDGNPKPDLYWLFNEELINSSVPLIRTQSGKYTAVSQNRLGQRNTSVDITIEYRPSLTCKDSYEVEEDAVLQDECEIMGEPEPVITWSKDGQQIQTSQRWRRHGSGNYQLTARNKLGTAEKEVHVNVLYAPVFKEKTSNVLVSPGENLTFVCGAEGNPVPDTHWEEVPAENVRQTPRGHQSNISITGATSTNARVYICHATNKVGRASRSVTVTMRGESTAVPAAVIWALLFILLIFIIIMLIVIYVKIRNRHGQYSFVPNNGADASNIPMTATSNGYKT